MSVCRNILMKTLVYPNAVFCANVSSGLEENKFSRTTEFSKIGIVVMFVILIIILGVCGTCKYHNRIRIRIKKGFHIKPVNWIRMQPTRHITTIESIDFNNTSRIGNNHIQNAPFCIRVPISPIFDTRKTTAYDLKRFRE